MIVDAADLGFRWAAEEAHDLARLGIRIVPAASAVLGFCHPENPDVRHFSFWLFAGPLERTAEGLWAGGRAIRPGTIERSPTGTALSKRMAMLHARRLQSHGRRERGRGSIRNVVQIKMKCSLKS